MKSKRMTQGDYFSHTSLALWKHKLEKKREVFLTISCRERGVLKPPARGAGLLHHKRALAFRSPLGYTQPLPPPKKKLPKEQFPENYYL